MMKYETALRNAKRGRLSLKKNPEFNNDKELVLLQLKYSGQHLKFVSDKLKSDKEVVMTAITGTNGGINLKYANPRLLYDFDIVMTSVKQESSDIFHEKQHIYKYLPNEMKTNYQIIKESLKMNPINYRYLPKEFKKDKKLFLSALKDNPNVYKSGLKEFRNDKEIFLSVLKVDSWQLRYASKELLNDKEVIYDILDLDKPFRLNSVYSYFSEDIRDDKKIFLEMIYRDKYTYTNASKRLQEDNECREKAIKCENYYVEW